MKDSKREDMLQDVATLRLVLMAIIEQLGSVAVTGAQLRRLQDSEHLELNIKQDQGLFRLSLSGSKTNVSKQAGRMPRPRDHRP